MEVHSKPSSLYRCVAKPTTVYETGRIIHAFLFSFPFHARSQRVLYMFVLQAFFNELVWPLLLKSFVSFLQIIFFNGKTRLMGLVSVQCWYGFAFFSVHKLSNWIKNVSREKHRIMQVSRTSTKNISEWIIIAGLSCLLLTFGQICSIRSERAVWLGFISYLAYYLLCWALPDKRCLSHGMCLYQVIMTLHFLNDVDYDAESTQKSKITSLSLVWKVKQWVNW